MKRIEANMAIAKRGTEEFRKRKKAIRELVLGVVKRMENQKGLNLKYYEDLFNNTFADTEAGDKAFEQWASQMGHELDDTITLCHLPFEEITVKQIQDAAKFIGLPLEQYVVYKHTGKPVRSATPVPVGYCNIKRLQQVLSKKQRLTLSSDKHASLKTGQLVRSSKNRIGNISDNETLALLAYDSEAMLKELLGPRADNNVSRAEMHNKIQQDGFVQLSDLSDNLYDKTSLVTFSTYLIASGLMSDLIENDLELDYHKRLKAEEMNIRLGKK